MRPKDPGDNVFTPATFPLAEGQESIPAMSIPELRSEDFEEVCITRYILIREHPNNYLMQLHSLLV